VGVRRPRRARASRSQLHFHHRWSSSAPRWVLIDGHDCDGHAGPSDLMLRYWSVGRNVGRSAPLGRTDPRAGPKLVVHDSIEVGDEEICGVKTVEAVIDADKHLAPLLRHDDVCAILAGLSLHQLQSDGICTTCGGGGRHAEIH
jgi:hypothetical protein